MKHDPNKNQEELHEPSALQHKCSVSISGYVYLLHAVGTNRYKIGRSISLKTRLQQLQKQSPFPLEIIAAFKTSNPAWDEAYWQDAYKKHRVHGEWFEFDEDYYRNTVKLFFWSRHEELRTGELAIALANSWGFDWTRLKESDKGKYFQEASDYLKTEPYNHNAHLEV